MKVLRYAGRDIVKVGLPDGIQGFYRSSGESSGMPGVWLPFDGIQSNGQFMIMRFWGSSWDKYFRGPLHRFGTHLLSGVSRILGMKDIPQGQEASIEEVNVFVDAGGKADNLEKIMSAPEIKALIERSGTGFAA